MSINVEASINENYPSSRVIVSARIISVGLGRGLLDCCESPTQLKSVYMFNILYNLRGLYADIICQHMEEVTKNMVNGITLIIS